MEEEKFREAVRESLKWMFYEFNLGEEYAEMSNFDLKKSHRICDQKLAVVLDELEVDVSQV